MGWSRVSNSWISLPRRLSTSRKVSRKEDSLPYAGTKREFLNYAFVATGAAREGFLVRVTDVDLCTVYATELETDWLNEEMVLKCADELGAAISLESCELLDALRLIFDVHSSSEFDERLILHLLHLEEWRQNVRTAKEAESYIENAAGTLTLLELTEDGTAIHRDSFCDISAVSIHPFDFRPIGREGNIGRSATEAEEGTEISCAAMIVLMQIVDGIGEEHGICSTCSQLSTAAKHILRLRGEIMRLFRRGGFGQRVRSGEFVFH